MYPFNYLTALYRRNNYGQICVWEAVKRDDHFIHIRHGIIGKTMLDEVVATRRKVEDEISSRIKAKIKTGYRTLADIKDNTNYPVEGELLSYLDKYLPYNRAGANDTLLAMLAKVYDDKVFDRCSSYIGQYKINGLRCFISAHLIGSSLFKPIGLRFQSREGTFWNSLTYLEDYLLEIMPKDFLARMASENIVLDGELYIPGYTVNQLNHFIKDPYCKENKFIQFWCYDLAVEDILQYYRTEILEAKLSWFVKPFVNKEEHLANTERLVVLPHVEVSTPTEALIARNNNINCGFEGLILRNPDAEYAFGKRSANIMIKYKKSTDGIFEVIDIKPEGIKRPDIPLLVCRNDINDATFEIHIGGTQSYQKSILKSKQHYIGKKVFVEYGERSGVNQLPFHVKTTRFI